MKGPKIFAMAAIAVAALGAGPANAQVTHTLSLNSTSGGWYSNLLVNTPAAGNHWNSAEIHADTFLGVTMKSPLDNTLLGVIPQPWGPPVPQPNPNDPNPTFVDTFLNSPGQTGGQLVNLSGAAFTPTNLDAAWTDLAGAVESDPAFIARIAFDVPLAMRTDPLYSLNLLGIGQLIATINGGSRTQLEGNVVQGFDGSVGGLGTVSVYNGIPEPATLSLLGLGALAFIRRRRA